MASRKRKNKYTCLNEGCFTHSWICLDHADENRPLFAAHEKEFIEKKQSIVFSHFCISTPGVKYWKP